jgi:hypothetical protein
MAAGCATVCASRDARRHPPAAKLEMDLHPHLALKRGDVETVDPGHELGPLVLGESVEIGRSLGLPLQKESG